MVFFFKQCIPFICYFLSFLNQSSIRFLDPSTKSFIFFLIIYLHVFTLCFKIIYALWPQSFNSVLDMWQCSLSSPLNGFIWVSVFSKSRKTFCVLHLYFLKTWSSPHHHYFFSACKVNSVVPNVLFVLIDDHFSSCWIPLRWDALPRYPVTTDGEKQVPIIKNYVHILPLYLEKASLLLRIFDSTHLKDRLT